jgi:hypothetical protein
MDQKLVTIPSGRVYFETKPGGRYVGTLSSVWCGQEFPDSTFTPFVTIELPNGDRISFPWDTLLHATPVVAERTY